MARQAFLVTLALGAFTTSVAAQIYVGAREIQQPPVYLKTLTSTHKDTLEEKKDLEADVLVEVTLDRVERAFRRGDADELEEYLVSGKRKIYLALEIDDDSQPAHYGPGQVRHIFGRLFREIETRSFVYDPTDLERRSGTTTVRADWTYVVLDTDAVVNERVELKLEKGQNDWRIYYIRVSSR